MTFYVVSNSDVRIDPVDGETPTHYNTPEEAGDAIVKGFHGSDYGTRYVLAVETSVAAEYTRPWTLVQKEEGS